MELSGLRKWLLKLGNGFADAQPNGRTPVCRTYDKDGNLIWSSTSLSSESLAKFLVVVSLVFLLIGYRLGGKKEEG